MSLDALKEFVRAAEKLAEQWPKDGSLNPCYPESLPSFDEFVLELHTWVNSVAAHQLHGKGSPDREAK